MQKMQPDSANLGSSDRKDGEAIRAVSEQARSRVAQHGESVRHSNVAPVTSSLLYFGLDWITLNVAPNRHKNKSIQFLDAIFSFPQNDTNASGIEEFVWGVGSETVSIEFSYTKQGDRLAQVFWNGTKIILIQFVDSDSTFKKNLKYKFKYMVNFYGLFFSLWRINALDGINFLQIFLDDIEAGTIDHSISRIDICADLSGITPLEIKNSIKIIAKDKARKISEYQKDLETGECETIYYGKKGDNRWFARIYNKIVEIVNKGKQKYYLDYLEHEQVTRFEIQVKSLGLIEYKWQLFDCLDLEKVLSLYSKHLHTKYVQWSILSIIQEEMKKKGFEKIQVGRHKKAYKALKYDKYFKLLLGMSRKCVENYGVTIDQVCDQLRSRFGDADR